MLNNRWLIHLIAVCPTHFGITEVGTLVQVISKSPYGLSSTPFAIIEFCDSARR